MSKVRLGSAAVTMRYNDSEGFVVCTQDGGILMQKEAAKCNGEEWDAMFDLLERLGLKDSHYRKVLKKQEKK